MRSTFNVLLILSSILALVSAIKFDLPAVTHDRISEGTKCLNQYVAKDTLVLATVNVGEGYNQRVELEVCWFGIIFLKTIYIECIAFCRSSRKGKLVMFIQRKPM